MIALDAYMERFEGFGSSLRFLFWCRAVWSVKKDKDMKYESFKKLKSIILHQFLMWVIGSDIFDNFINAGLKCNPIKNTCALHWKMNWM